MKKIFFSLVCLLILKSLFAQQAEFEGVIEYKVEVSSKLPEISAKNMRTLLFLGDKLTIYIKQGNYKRIGDICEEYYNPEKQKLYIKFKGIDTLFYLDYNSDTTKLLNFSKSNETATIAGYECKTITFKFSSSSTKSFYAPALYIDPKHDATNTLGHYNVYTKETESVWLGHSEEAENYSLKETCTRLEKKEINNAVFTLPDFPERKFSLESIITPPAFLGRGKWESYLQQNLNAQLGAKYIKIPKGESEARQTVQVSFVISAESEILNLQVLNKDDVHKKLAEEAVRVIKESPGWKPANVFGVKVPFKIVQPITFVAQK